MERKANLNTFRKHYSILLAKYIDIGAFLILTGGQTNWITFRIRNLWNSNFKYLCNLFVSFQLENKFSIDEYFKSSFAAKSYLTLFFFFTKISIPIRCHEEQLKVSINKMSNRTLTSAVEDNSSTCIVFERVDDNGGGFTSSRCDLLYNKGI